MSTATKINAKITTVVLECPKCLSFHDVGVRLVSEGCAEDCRHGMPHQDPEMDFILPDNCGCGESLDTPKNIRDVQDTAIIIFTLAGVL